MPTMPIEICMSPWEIFTQPHRWPKAALARDEALAPGQPRSQMATSAETSAAGTNPRLPGASRQKTIAKPVVPKPGGLQMVIATDEVTASKARRPIACSGWSLVS